MSWLRLEDHTDQDPALVDLAEEHGPIVHALWLVLLCQSKSRGHAGLVDISAKSVARTIGSTADEIVKCLACMESQGLVTDVTVTAVSHGSVQIASFRKFNIDPTATERKARQRARTSQSEEVVTEVTESHGSHAVRDLKSSRAARARLEARPRAEKPGITEAGRRAYDELREQERLAADAIRFKELGLPNPNEEDAA